MALGTRITALSQRIGAEFKTLRSVDLGGLKTVRLTKAQYLALATPRDANTRYVITDWLATDATAPASPGTGGKVISQATVPPIGGYATNSGVLSYGYNSQTPGRLFAVPFWIGPTGWTADAFRTRISQARVGGVTVRRFALVPDLNGYPDTLPANRLAYAAVDDSVTTGGNGGDFTFSGGAVALQPGMYWMLSLFAITSGSVTTTANMSSITNASYGLPTDSNNAPDAVVRSICVDGQTDLPTIRLAQSVFVAHKGNETPALLLRRSA